MKCYDHKKRRALKERAKRLFSRFIRLRDKGICFTCYTQMDVNYMEAGHLEHNVLDFDELNLNCQCKRCNQHKSGSLETYKANFINIWGMEMYEDLRARAMMERATAHKYTIDELEGICKTYKKKIEDIE